jgi:hypothetical protein
LWRLDCGFSVRKQEGADHRLRARRYKAWSGKRGCDGVAPRILERPVVEDPPSEGDGTANLRFEPLVDGDRKLAEADSRFAQYRARLVVTRLSQ